MSLIFKNIVFSKSILFFKQAIFKEHVHLKDEYNINEPVIMFGLYRNEDLKLVLNHKSYCMIIFGGSDTFITDNRNPHISRGRIFFLNQIKPQMFKNKKSRHCFKLFKRDVDKTGGNSATPY